MKRYKCLKSYKANGWDDYLWIEGKIYTVVKEVYLRDELHTVFCCCEQGFEVAMPMRILREEFKEISDLDFKVLSHE